MLEAVKAWCRLGVVAGAAVGPIGKKKQAMIDATIPRRIYTFWDRPSAMPLVARQCIERFQCLHPDWVITVFSDADLPADRNHHVHGLPASQRADWVRLRALAAAGGVWLDATCVLVRPVHSWVDVSNDASRFDLQGFQAPWADRPEDEPILESWAFAAPAQNAFVSAWFREFDHAASTGTEAYCRAHAENLPPGLRPHLPYLTIHAAFCVVRRSWSDSVRVHCRPSGLPDGPFALHERLRWESEAVAAAVATTTAIWPDPSSALPPLMCKLRSAEWSLVHTLPPILMVTPGGRHHWPYWWAALAVVVLLVAAAVVAHCHSSANTDAGA